MFEVNKKYLYLTILLFVIEVFIALFVHDNFIRPYFGDVLVVILIYCFVKSFFKVAVTKACVGVLLFAFGIETLQHFALVEKLNLQDNQIAKTVIGTSFSWEDILAYVVGMLVVMVFEKLITKKRIL